MGNRKLNAERKKMKVLVVDGDENEREAARLSLEGDYQLHTVGCYNDMKNAMYRCKYDVVLTNDGLRERFGGNRITCSGFAESNPYVDIGEFLSSVERWGHSGTCFKKIQYPNLFAIFDEDRSCFNRTIEGCHSNYEILEEEKIELCAPRKIYNLNDTIAVFFTREDLPLSYLYKAEDAILTASSEALTRNPIMVKNWKAGLEALLEVGSKHGKVNF